MQYKFLKKRGVWQGFFGPLYEGFGGLYEWPAGNPIRTLYVDFVHPQKNRLTAPKKRITFVWIETQVSKTIVISKGTEFFRIPADRLVYVAADGNYSTVVTQDNRKTMVSLQLGQIEDLIGDQLGDEGSNFIRLGRGLVINTDFIFSIDTTRQRIVLSDCHGCYHDLSASREVLIKFKSYLESSIQSHDESTE